MNLLALKQYWPFSTSADVDAEEHLPSTPQRVASSDVSELCPDVRLVTPPASSVPQERWQPCPSTLSTNRVQEHRPDTLSAKPAPLGNSRASQRAVAGVSKHRRRKRGKIGRLYDEGEANKAEFTAEVHAACLLLDVALARPHLVGTWVTKDQLCRWYQERVARDGGKVQSWILVAKKLKRWTVSERRTCNGKKQTYYRITRITTELKKRAAISHSLPKPTSEAT